MNRRLSSTIGYTFFLLLFLGSTVERLEAQYYPHSNEIDFLLDHIFSVLG